MLRVTRQYVEVLARPAIPTSAGYVISTISFGNSVSVTQIKNVPVTNTVVFANLSVGGKIITAIAGNTVAFSQDTYRTYTVENDLLFGTTAYAILAHIGITSSSASFGQAISVTAVHNVLITNAVQVITEVYDPVTETMVDVIDGLDSSVVASRIDGTPSGIQHHLQFGSRVNVVLIKSTAIDVAVSNAISFGQDLFKNQIGSGINTVQFSQILNADYCKPVSSELDFENLVVAVFNRSRNVSNAIEFDQSVTFSIATVGVLTQYHPFVGAGASGPPITLNVPMPGITAQFQLVYPAEGTVTDSVSLRSPDFGNKDQLSFNRISRETRGGTLIVYADPIWPKIETLVLTFSSLRRGEAQALLDFLDSYLGQEVGLIDWEQRYWKGIIVTPENPVIEDSKDSFSASFNFEGAMDPTWTPQVIPVLPNTPLIPRIPIFSAYCETEEPVTPIIPTNVYYAEIDEIGLAGQVIYIKATGHVGLSMADAMPEAGAIGLLFANILSGGTATYLTEGSITLSDWTAISGTLTLTPGALYWLSNSVPGGMSSTAPSMGYVVQLGRATSTTTFDIEIQESVRL